MTLVRGSRSSVSCASGASSCVLPIPGLPPALPLSLSLPSPGQPEQLQPITNQLTLEGWPGGPPGPGNGAWFRLCQDQSQRGFLRPVVLISCFQCLLQGASYFRRCVFSLALGLLLREDDGFLRSVVSWFPSYLQVVWSAALWNNSSFPSFPSDCCGLETAARADGFLVKSSNVE